jgi:putative transcriptional regulator
VRRVLDSLTKKNFNPKGYLVGKLLVATPFTEDNRFEHSVIYLCGHDEYGAIGLIINKPLNSLNFLDLLSQLDIPNSALTKRVPMYSGGPVEVSRGFVLHSKEYQSDSTVRVGENFYITATLDILRSLSHGHGPDNFLLALGYVGWGAGQLELELHENFWMVVDSTHELVFNTALDLKWKASMAVLGVNPAVLNMEAGRA